MDHIIWGNPAWEILYATIFLYFWSFGVCVANEKEALFIVLSSYKRLGNHFLVLVGPLSFSDTFEWMSTFSSRFKLPNK